MTIDRPSLVRTTPALHRIAVGEVTLFYREAGAPERPTFLGRGFCRDNPNAAVHLLDTGHFALETHAVEIADRIRSFLGHITD
jgi:hypothetical protein